MAKSVEIPVAHPLSFISPTYGELSKTGKKALAAYETDVAKVAADESALKKEYADLLASGMTMVVSDVLDAGEALDAHRRALNERYRAMKGRRFTLAAELVDDFKQIAKQAESDYERGITSAIAQVRSEGMTEAPESVIRADIIQRLPAVEMRARVRRAKGESAGVEELAGVDAPNDVMRDYVKWPEASGDDAAIIARLIASSN
jgi:hypothetical protein